MRFAYPPYAGTFFICWGDKTLNMIVSLRFLPYLSLVGRISPEGVTRQGSTADTGIVSGYAQLNPTYSY
uniref:Uncharacterized protein n=1 Tax=Candidatus Kentrum sp. UNK TaxID=2126344 RepID=A0A451ALJ1_9GAMM|nr:MAG: hypothetical protein BECKUNK1418G_GA0071005_11151 [Candidatus Kentron sp. UNK]VFK72338.1 MAG: hypothetical protein BECKUNK1418H_GA0071006_11091 [Candidatus Kentron sp. UNK]